MSNMEQKIKMFGCNPDNYLASIKNSLSYKFSGAGMCACSVLSDAQELMAMGDVERARQEINLAKLIIMEMMDGNLVLNVERGAA
jgi:hypothetical protein